VYSSLYIIHSQDSPDYNLSATCMCSSTDISQADNTQQANQIYCLYLLYLGQLETKHIRWNRTPVADRC